NFAGNDRLVCRFTGNAHEGSGVLVGFSRLVSIDLDGHDLKQLGQQSSFYDRGLRQFDGSVLDWHAGKPGTVLMEREYVPEIGKTGTRVAAEKQGLGVDIVDAHTGRASAIEAPLPDAAEFMSDGLGNVRIKIH